MKNTTEFLQNIRRITKLHEVCIHPVCDQYHLTMIETTIIGFLKNNPEADTAADIVELRMLSKGHVSQAVEALIQKGLLTRTPDPEDRRRIHLSLLPAAAPIAEAILVFQEQFYQELWEGFSENDLQQYISLNRRIQENTRKALERRKAL